MANNDASFLGLPLELRDEIYGYLLIPKSPDHFTISEKTMRARIPEIKRSNAFFAITEDDPMHEEPTALWTAILRVNQQISAEAQQALFRESRFKVFAHDMTSDARPTLLQAPKLLITVKKTIEFSILAQFLKKHRGLHSLRVIFNLEANEYIIPKIRQWKSPVSLRPLLSIRATNVALNVDGFTGYVLHRQYKKALPAPTPAFDNFQKFYISMKETKVIMQGLEGQELENWRVNEASERDKRRLKGYWW